MFAFILFALGVAFAYACLTEKEINISIKFKPEHLRIVLRYCGYAIALGIAGVVATYRYAVWFAFHQHGDSPLPQWALRFAPRSPIAIATADSPIADTALPANQEESPTPAVLQLPRREVVELAKAFRIRNYSRLDTDALRQRLARMVCSEIQAA